MFSRLYTIAANTFVETIRQPIYSALLIVTVLMMIANVGLAAFTLEDDDKLLRDLGLSTLLLSGLFLSAFSATGVLTREIENKTVLTVLSKPVKRFVFILGKYLGLLAALFLAYYIGFLAFAMSLRHKVLQNSSDPWDQPILVFGFGGVLGSLLLVAFLNYFNTGPGSSVIAADDSTAVTKGNWSVLGRSRLLRGVARRSFGADAIGTSLAIVTPVLTIGLIIAAFFDANWTVQPFSKGFVSFQSIIAAFMVMLAVMIIAAVALAASTRLGQIMTLLVCTMVLMLGLVSDYALGRHQEASAIAAAAYRLYPNLGIFWVLDALNANIPIPPEYIAKVGLYAVLQVSAILLIGVALFQKREVG